MFSLKTFLGKGVFFFVDFECCRLKTDMFGFAAEPIAISNGIQNSSQWINER